MLDIAYLDSEFKEIGKGSSHITDGFFKTKSSWVLPQIMALLNSEVKLAKNSDGKYSFKLLNDFFRSAFSDPDYFHYSNGKVLDSSSMKGILKVLTFSPRGYIIPSSTKDMRYTNNVPLFLSAFKEYRNINYSDWAWNEPEAKYYVDEFNLAIADYVGDEELFKSDCPWNKDELIQLRDKLMIVKRTGESKSPTKVLMKVEKAGLPAFDELPQLVKLQLLQFWVCHSSLATKYNINCSVNPDTQPEPLDTAAIMAEPEPAARKRVKVKEETTFTCPWD